MITRYLETFDKTHATAETIVPDLMRHIHARQHLGKAVVLCEEPEAMMGLAEKQWRKLSRVLQRQRTFTTNAVEILKYTYTITQMQHASFTTESVHDNPEAKVYFASADRMPRLSADCLSLYMTASVEASIVDRLVVQLPNLCLLVDYSGQIKTGQPGLELRSELEKSVSKRWHDVKALLTANQIDINRLLNPAFSTEAIDDAVDELLNRDAEFLALANDFQRRLDLARPLRSTPRAMRDQYEVFIVLAHRVQTFATGSFSPQFLRTYANDTFFLHDQLRVGESFAMALQHHEAAGRANIVRAMMRMGGLVEPELSQPLMPGSMMQAV